MGEKPSFLTLGALLGIIAACLAVGIRSLSPSENSCGRRVLKLAHGLEAGHPVHIAMLELKKDVEKMSCGELTIDIYGGAVLGSETQCLEQLRNGSLDMTKASSAQIGTFVPKMYLLTLPYMYDDSAHYWKVLDSATGEKFFSFLRGGGFVGLCYYDAGARSFYSSKKKIERPDDLAGMKIRVMNSRADMEMAASFGASPTVVSAAETYTSLAQGLVDGA